MPRLSKIGAAALAAFGWTSGAGVTASFLVIAGGGSGGKNAVGGGSAGGGGAGEVINGTSLSLNPTLSYTITVGAGGATQTTSNTSGNNGNNSSIGSTVIAIGGGGGGAFNDTFNGKSGGSGGGGCYFTPGTGGASTTGTLGGGTHYGNAGGSGASGDNASGGGGGAGAVGGNASGNTAGVGGNGQAFSISGSSVTYGGGGGGGNYNSTGGAGGSGGGGAGSVSGAAASNGTANLGGGGGGGGDTGSLSGSGGAGGSGVVIISYVGAQQFGGGTVTSSGGSTIHTFTSSGVLSPLSSLTASYLIVAGGGGGGSIGGGGGAGGLLSGSGLTLDTNSIYTVTVGAGGAISGGQGVNGSNSSFSAYATSAVGGGYGGGYGNPTGLSGATGGSGGGGGYCQSSSPSSGGAGTAGQGSAGGTGTVGSAGGGGGASAVGGNAAGGTAGNGGNGSASSISGSSVTYAGGGGGESESGTAGTGGSGGGGRGGLRSGANAVAGTANLGGGGGGGDGLASAAAGGSGVVIISYPGSTQQMAGGTVTVAGGNVIHTFTSSGYLTPIVLVNNSLRFRSSASAYLNRTFTQSGDTQKFTQSVWCKRGTLGAFQTIGYTFFTGTYNGQMRFNSNDTLDIYVYYDGSSYTGQLSTTQVFRDPSAWYHFVLAVDTTQATASNRIKFYVNGVQVTAFGTANYPNQNQALLWNASGNTGYFINAQQGNQNFFDGYLAELNYIDGQALTPNSFGTSNGLGVWQPIRYGGSYGTNGFYLPFTNSGSGAVTTTYLVVAGGGGGAGTASDAGGGGGAGGYQTSTLSVTPGVSYTVTVGAGGTGGVGDNNGNQGSNSVFSSVTSTGGGGGGYWNSAGGSGGSAGGSGCNITSSTAGTAGQGNAGGVPATANQNNAAGGGGGAGAAGGNVAAGSGLSGGVGGVGLQSSITGASTYYAGGGGGGPSNSGGPATGAGGLGGGGGGNAASSDGVAGTANTGGGGGAAARNSGGGTRTGGTGGSGVVIISYAGAQQFTGGTVTSSGGNTIHTFTSSGTFGSNIAADYSPQGNNWTTNNISLTAGSTYDSMTDVPTLTSATAANYAVLNAVSGYSGLPITNANIQTSAVPSGSDWYSRSTTMGFSSGKIYAEFSMPSITSGAQGSPIGFGIIPSTNDFSASGQLVGDANRGYGFYCPDTSGSETPKKRVAGTNTSVGTASATITTDIFMVAFDLTNGNGWFGKNGTWYAGDPAAGTSASITGITAGEYIFGLSVYRDTTFTNNTAAINFGQRPFSYTPPTGFVALNTFNLPTPTIGATASSQADNYFNAVLWTGDGNSPRSFTGIGFAPDFAWIKNRTGASDHALIDIVRGTGSKVLSSNLTDAENGIGLVINSFDSDGYTLATGSINFSYANTNTSNYVAWNWKANGAGVTNTAGSITSTVSANTTAGFSIVTYTGNGTGGATVGHGLGVAPSMVIVKKRSGVADWPVQHISLGPNASLRLNGTDATANEPWWNSTAPSSTVFTLGSSNTINQSSETFVAYCFAPVAGYSAFGSYIGNSSTNGTFVYLGFRPRFVMIKRATSADPWIIHDTARDIYNGYSVQLYPNDASAEGGPYSPPILDEVSNGFKLRSSASGTNDSGSTYIYMAFAENPFKYANAR